MTATPYKAVLKFLADDGTPLQYPVTVSDVAGEYWVFPDGSSSVVLPNGKIWHLTDVVCTGSGADTTKNEVYVNSTNTGYLIFQSLNLATNMNRQFNNNPMSIAGGAKISIKQVA